MENTKMCVLRDLNLQKRLKERFFRYVAVESQSREGADEVPSSPGQWTLARLLMCDLEALGLQGIAINEHCVVQAHLPARLHGSRKNVPSIGFVCHLDTVDVGLSPEIKPVLIRNYQGGDICQNREKHLYISVKEHPELMDYIGEDIIVSDGTSVLGADNKAAIANVMTVLEILREYPELEHGDLYVAFVPDEEIGLLGSREIDFDKFPVDYAYTIDSCALGEVVYETFNAASAELRIRGISAHPMSSKNTLVNPVMVAVDFINLLNRAETPEHTEGREGYIWVTGVRADMLNCTVSLNIRDHDRRAYEARKKYLEEALKITKLRHPKAEIELEIHDVYGNIADAVTPENRKCIDYLYRALEELQIPAKTIAMRGGTDGSYISTRGILTPNYFTGAHNFHSRCEFWPMGSAEKSCLTTLKLIELAARKD
ncbi:MAG TPA: peptidase T [Clostridiaceae bacterium]|nr:peptidase T [Clostridiaceae bacterium]